MLNNNFSLIHYSIDSYAEAQRMQRRRGFLEFRDCCLQSYREICTLRLHTIPPLNFLCVFVPFAALREIFSKFFFGVIYEK